MGRAAIWGTLLSAALLVGVVTGQARQQQPPNQLVHQVISHEVQAEEHDNSYWMFRLQQTESGATKSEEVVETPHGWVCRLLAVNGKPLTQQEQAKDDARLHKLLTDAGEQRKNEEATRNDVRQAQELLKMLPDAFLYTYAGRNGEVVKLNFRPNPKFQPQSRKAVVFHDNGGTFDVKQTQIAPGIWDVTYMNVQMNGKALFFKTIAVREKDIRSNYRRVPSNLTLAQAAKLVKKETNTLAAKR
jgi:hypothetical protein